MYYYISGELVLVEPSRAVIDAGGVGYELTISGQTCGKLAGKNGEKVRLYTHLSVREDAMELFGFFTYEELTAFRLLITVSGIGAKSAIAVLSMFSPEQLSLAVMNGDSKAISRVNGVGSKTAARIVLELKDKIAKELPSGGGGETSVQDFAPAGDSFGEAVSALLVLGYSRSEAQYGLKGAPRDADIEELIKFALSRLAKQ